MMKTTFFLISFLLVSTSGMAQDYDEGSYYSDDPDHLPGCVSNTLPRNAEGGCDNNWTPIITRFNCIGLPPNAEELCLNPCTNGCERTTQVLTAGDCTITRQICAPKKP